MLGNTGFEVVFSFPNVGGIAIRVGTRNAINDVGTVLKWDRIFKIGEKVGEFVMGFKTKAQSRNCGLKGFLYVVREDRNVGKGSIYIKRNRRL